jgi:para-nitrobenzyl esterase
METLTSVVHTTSGSLAGLRNGDICTYWGIPFAASTAGAGRWAPPGPAPTWTGTREATAFGYDPIQPPNPKKRSRAPGQSEDCLSLNIWTPAERGSEPWPVMVWLEGGSFMTESGAGEHIDGAPLARHGVVLVTLNYRLSIFGFLAHELLTKESPHHFSSNYGLLDQLAALRWLKANVAAFGGDPKRITVFGVSAGSASIALLLTSPLADGAFDQAILHSPGALRPLYTLGEAEQLGAVAGNDLAAMRALPPDQLLATNPKIAPRVRGLTTPRILRPICDGYVVPIQESEAYAAGKFRTIPIMIGSAGNEGAWAVGDMPIATLAEYRTYMQENFNEATAEALQRYPANSDAEVKGALAEVFGDTQFSYGARGVARAVSRKQPKVYRYVFREGTAGHADDTPYVFGTLPASANAGSRRVSDVQMRAWTNFAKTGDPNGPGVPSWTPFTEVADNYLDLNASTLAMRDHWRTEHLDFIGRYLGARSIQP